jgi:hypothetical protein
LEDLITDGKINEEHGAVWSLFIWLGQGAVARFYEHCDDSSEKLQASQEGLYSMKLINITV